LKTQCLNTLEVLEEVHTELVNFIEKKQTVAAAELLAQCQQGAISIGNIIEEAGGDGAEEVKALEQYCELTYQLHEDLLRGVPINARQMAKKLKKPLIIASNGIRNRIPTQREIVFLPYKASMWDSLESVWKEMDADPTVTAIVMPIPYYDKDPDGAFRQLHYEGMLFPIDVPVVSYQSYNIKERHPDAIYIHNPYDEANYVTSVHPDFYSSKLKEYTDELVYIPYFILGDIVPGNRDAVESVEHFVTVPGVINAHRVIVQSKEWRQVYIDVMTKYAGRNTRRYWEKKIETAVSPKVKRVRNLTTEDYEIPEEWKKVTKKSDGSRKKVIFYNTSIGALLQENDGMLDKISKVLAVFRDNGENVALLWRPHPLIEATLTSMRPQLWVKYKAIVDEYRSSGWGIYDDSPEIDRAIAVSDAYYGDWSSVVWLYKETGKPIMIQSVEV